jgi:hypothetical protein
MTKTVRAVAGQLHHLPWVLAGIVLVAGVANWALFGRQADKPATEPEPEKPAAVMIDQESFRQAALPGQGGEDGQVEPFVKVEPFPVAGDDPNK